MSRSTTRESAPVRLSGEEYEQLKGAAETYRESLLVRFCGEVGLRPPEIARITPADFVTRSTRNGTHHVLTVANGDSGEGSIRQAYVPHSLRSAVTRYVNEQGIEPSERIVDVTPRRIQMIVSGVADRAADRFDRDPFRRVSSRELCQHFARRLVHGEGVDPRVVQAVGPWDGLESLSQHLDPVDAGTVLDALEATSLSSQCGGRGLPAVGRALADADLSVLVTDTDGVVEYANDGFAALTGHTNGDLSGTDVTSLYAGDDPVTPRDADGSGAAHVRLRRADGTPVEVLQTATPLRNEYATGDGHLTVFVEPVDTEDSPPGRSADAPDRLRTAITGLHAVNDALSTVSSRDEAESRVCERLASVDAYEFAWIGSVTGDRRITAKANAGLHDAAADALADATAGTAGSASTRAVQSGEVQVVTATDRNADADTLAAVLGSDAESDAVAVVPLTYGETTHGVLALGIEGRAGVASEERRVLASLGWQVGQVLTDIKRKKLLLADSVLELEFRTGSSDAFFVAASDRFDASFRLEGLVPGESQSLLYFVTMRGASPDEVFPFATDADSIENVRLIRDYGESHLIEFVVRGEEPATTLTELGGHVTEFVIEDGRQRILAEFTTETDVRSVFSGLQSAFPGSELFSKQEVQRPVQTTDGFRRSLEDDLTEKQQSVLRAAHLAGYFEWPRGSTAEELADSIGVSSPTLHNHLRKAQQKLLTAFFDDVDE